jgi:hypothetical protein
MLNNILNEWYEFKVLGNRMKFSDLLNNVLSKSNRFPVTGKLLSTIPPLSVSTASWEIQFNKMNLIKTNSVQHWEHTV